MADISTSMRLFSEEGERLYLNKDERIRFLVSAQEENRDDRLFCSVLHYTGCRPSEVLELTPARIYLTDKQIQIRSLKKRKFDRQGNKKSNKEQYRLVPVPDKLIDELDLVFDLRYLAKIGKDQKTRLWGMDRTTAWRMVKRVMQRAGITGKQATTKGLRHGFGIAMLEGERPVPITVLRDLMGHSDSKITEIRVLCISVRKYTLGQFYLLQFISLLVGKLIFDLVLSKALAGFPILHSARHSLIGQGNGLWLIYLVCCRIDRKFVGD